MAFESKTKGMIIDFQLAKAQSTESQWKIVSPHLHKSKLVMQTCRAIL